MLIFTSPIPGSHFIVIENAVHRIRTRIGPLPVDNNGVSLVQGFKIRRLVHTILRLGMHKPCSYQAVCFGMHAYKWSVVVFLTRGKSCSEKKQSGEYLFHDGSSNLSIASELEADHCNIIRLFLFLLPVLQRILEKRALLLPCHFAQ